MNITLSKLFKSFGAQQVIDNVSLEIRDGEMFFLLGPSGCGKTTILRMLAGFFPPDRGDILFGEKRVNDEPPQARNTALVFQNYAIWPHLTIYENVAYGLRVRDVAKAELDERVRAALAQVRLQDLAERKPATLSGGQQQRVALARAMVVRPALLLFDEPLSNLDAKLRAEMREEIKRLHREHRPTSLYVTHDQEEALSLADRIAVLHQGKVQQVGTPQEVYEHPANPFVAGFIGQINLYPAGSRLGAALGLDPKMTFGFRPENVQLLPEGQPAPGEGHALNARVNVATYLGGLSAFDLGTAEGETMKAVTSFRAKEGESAQVFIPKEKIWTWPAEG